MALQQAKQLVTAVRQHGWAGAVAVATGHDHLSIEALLEQYHRAAVSRGLRPRSIRDAEQALRRLARETGARRVGDLTPAVLQGWIRESRLKPVTLRSVLKNAACVFSRPSLQALGLSEVQNPFARLIRPKVDREPFPAPSRAWILHLMQQGIKGQVTGNGKHLGDRQW